MTLQSNGEITAYDLREELTELGQARLGSDNMRLLAEIPTGPIGLSDFYAKTRPGSIPAGVWVTKQNHPFYGGRSSSGFAGSSTNGLMWGGHEVGDINPIDTTWKFDGSAWSTHAAWDYNGEVSAMGNCGSSGDALSWSGLESNVSIKTMRYSSNSWTTKSSLPFHIEYPGSFGQTSAAVSVGGYEFSHITLVNNVQTFNGTAWTEGTPYPIPAQKMRAAGTATSGKVWGGNQAISGVIHHYQDSYDFDGTTWTASVPYPIEVAEGGGSGTSQTDCLGWAGGYTDGVGTPFVYLNATYHFTGTGWAYTALYPKFLYAMGHGSSSNVVGSFSISGISDNGTTTSSSYGYT